MSAHVAQCSPNLRKLVRAAPHPRRFQASIQCTLKHYFPLDEATCETSHRGLMIQWLSFNRDLTCKILFRRRL